MLHRRQPGGVGHYRECRLEELFATCDIVCISRKRQNTRMIDEKLLAHEKDALFVSYGRAAASTICAKP